MKKLHKDNTMKINYTILTSVVAMTISSCSHFGSSPDTIPAPPKAGNTAIVLPQIGNPNQANISESSAARANESQPTRFKTITETRTPGGGVSKVNVDNPSGGMPDYYLAPSQIPYDTNNNPDKLSPPSWEWSW